MTKIKICGLNRVEDIHAVNACLPDYAGFVIDFPKSRRSVSIEKLKELVSLLDKCIVPVGVFVDASVDTVADLLNSKTIQVTQLHGNEDKAYVNAIKKMIPQGSVWKAFQIRTENDIERAMDSNADMIVLDNGKGTGKKFDWEVLKIVDRPYFLAGGVNEKNAYEAIEKFSPYGLDVSGSVETDGLKDREKIINFVQKIRTINTK